MLAFTPDVETALRLFRGTHELVNADGRAWYRQAFLPGPGGYSEQDARVMAALALLRRVHDDLIARTRKTRDDDG